MILKSGTGGARIAGIKPEILMGALILDSVHREVVGGADMVVTECTGGTHQPGSLHYVGLAIDVRTRDMTAAQAAEFYLRARAAVGDDFDLVQEGTPPHLHLEFQPKTPMGA